MELFDPFFQAGDANGLPLSGAKLYFYRADTSSLVTIYQDASGATPHTNPVTADASGLFPPIYLSTDYALKTILKTAAGVTVQTVPRLDPTGADPWLLQPLGTPIPISADLFDTVAEALPPTDQGYRYILLTAGNAGSGEYNEGILTNESVSGSYPLVIATAEIAYPTSPFDGKTVHLLNTEGRYLIGGATAGVVRMDQMQQITGAIGTTGSGGLWGSISGVSGAFSAVADGTANQPASGSSAARTLSFDSANSPGARAGAETHGKDIAVLYVLRII